MELWIPITIAAAFLQNLRSALQRHLKGRLGTTGATYVRFAFGVPFALLYVAGLVTLAGLPLPTPNWTFALYTALGGITQILGTASLLAAFSYRNFAVGTAYSKTEAVQTAVFAIVILGEPVGLAAALAILIAFVGVMVLSTARSDLGAIQLLRDLSSPAALYGIGSGAGFGISAVCYRAAALSLGGEGFLIQAAFTLVSVIIFQTLIMTVWMAWREPSELGAVWRARRTALWVGLTGMAASAGWFTAMTIQNAALVRALGQIELVFTFLAAHFLFGERSNAREVLGVVLLVAGILTLLLGR